MKSRDGSRQNGRMKTGYEAAVGAPGQAILAKRHRFQLAYCVVGRSYQMLAARSSRSPRRIAAVGACAICDLAIAGALRKSHRFALLPRLAINALDGALWSQADIGLSSATMSGIPLAFEAGLRLGAAGLVVPAVNASVTSIVRLLRGRRPSALSFRYQAIDVALGAAIATYERNRRKVTRSRHQRELEARISAAHLAGQNSIASGADTVVDLLSRTMPLLSSPARSAGTGAMLADWKQSLAASTTEHATYLGIALAKWRRRHNDSHPDLAEDVNFEIRAGAGAILLTSHQAAWLESTLDQLVLRGMLIVTVSDIDQARRPNRPCRLAVGEHVIDVPPDPRPDLVPFDFAPLGFLAASLWFADTRVPGECDSALWAVGPVIASGPPLAIWSHREVVRRGEAAHGRVLFAALGQALANAVASTGTMRNIRNHEGIQRFPFLLGIEMVAMMTPLYWRDLDANQRLGAIAAIAVILALGLVLFPERVQWSHFTVELLWAAAAFYSMSAVRPQLAADASWLRAELEVADQHVLTNAFAEGRSYVLGLVSETRNAAWREFAAIHRKLDARMRAEVERRLNEVDTRLEELSCATES